MTWWCLALPSKDLEAAAVAVRRATRHPALVADAWARSDRGELFPPRVDGASMTRDGERRARHRAIATHLSHHPASGRREICEALLLNEQTTRHDLEIMLAVGLITVEGRKPRRYRLAT